MSTIVILGAGVGGIVTANELRHRLPRHHDIVLVEKDMVHSFAPSFLWVMTGDRRPQEITRPLHSLVRSGVSVVNADVTGIHPAERRVATSGGTIAYDYLVIALGAELAPGRVSGLQSSAYSFYSLSEAIRLRDALLSFRAGTVVMMVAALPYKCPGAPHEGAMLIADHFRKRGLRNQVDIHLYTPEPQPMPVAGPQLGESVRGMLASKGIELHPLHKLVSVDSEHRLLLFDGKDRVSYDLLVAIPPHRAPGFLRDAGLTNEAGWVPVDRSTLETQTENVFAIGDVTAISIPGRWKADVPMNLPKAGVFVHTQAEIVAKRIVDRIAGRTSDATFCGAGYCMLEAGEGMAGFASGDFFAEPAPKLQLRKIGKAWHLGKVLFERWWLAPFGFRKTLYRLLLVLGAKVLRIPI